MDDHAPLIERAFALEPDERVGASVEIHGRLPSSLLGTCFLNGPARFSRGGLRYHHWLDGDGMVCALTFARDGVRCSNRFVRTAKLVAEEAAGRPLFRTFGTAFDGDVLKRGIGLESPANVSAYPYGGTLLALGEQGLPWDIDPVTLETRGLFTFGGQLNEITPFGAHPKIDHRTGELFNFGVSFSSQQPALHLFRFADGGSLVYRRRLPLPYPASIHDFAISASYIAFYVSPLVLDVGALVSGATVMDALSWQPERGSRFVIASRESGEPIASIDIGNRYCLHLVNAFDRDDRLIVDLIEYEKPLYPEYQVIPWLFTDTFRGGPIRLEIDVHAAAVVGRREIAYTCSPDFPAHDAQLTGLPYEHFWMLGISRAGRPGRKFFDQLVRVDWQTARVDVYQAPPAHYLGGEPLFIPDRDEPERGVVLCQVFDAARVSSSFALFDAFDLARGPMTTLTLASPIPLLFHSSFLGAGS